MRGNPLSGGTDVDEGLTSRDLVSQVVQMLGGAEQRSERICRCVSE